MNRGLPLHFPSASLLKSFPPGGLMAALALACLLQTAPPAVAASPVQITAAVDNSRLAKLAGNTRPEATPANDQGPVSDSLAVDHILLLLQRSPQQEQALDTLIGQLNDRSSPNFHHWLTAAQIGQNYGVAQQDIDTITSWLTSQGFRVNQVYTSGVVIDFSGTAGQIARAFHTSLHNLSVNGVSHIANMSDPSIPAALTPVVKGIASLHDFKPHPLYKSKKAADYTFGGCASSANDPNEPGTCYGITPQDNQTIYNINPLYAAGFSGQGQTIALIEDTDTYGGAADWNTYRSTFGLATAYPLGSYTQIHPGCTDPGTNGDDGEAAIDVEVASAIAPSAAIVLVACPGGTLTFGGLIALQNLINAGAPYPGVVSVSYGVCEAFNGNGGNAAFYSTYQQAAAQGISVFVSAGDEGPSSCSTDFSIGSEYDVASLGITGWGQTPYNVSVGGTDFEDVYNAKTGANGGAALSTYWSATNTSGFGSALSYIPEIPWNDACASVLISEAANSTNTTYGTGTCNTSPYNTSSSFLSTGAASGGASNCAVGSGGTTQGADGISDPQCQGYAKPSWQSGSSLPGGQAVYGQPADGVRDIPDVSMFAANGVWGHFEVVCWSDPAYTADGSASCAGAPSTWSGFGGTSISSPTMAALQALVNQKTGEIWGNPDPVYYQIAQGEYGTAGGSFLGSGCNSSTGPGSGCVFNDVTQGDIDLACEDNGSAERAHCYKPSGTYGVDSTDNVTAATIINGGSGYTSAPTCAIAAPTNNSPYVTPTGTTLWAGGTQASCTATVSSATTSAVWKVQVASTSAVGTQIIVGPTTYTLAGASTTAIASALSTAIDSGNAVASSTVSGSTVTITAKTPGEAGNFTVSFGTATEFDTFYVYITNSTLGQGPNYVNAISIASPGSGYQPETPITLTGVGTGAIAVANSSPATAAQSYQPAYGAAPGYDLATGLGTPNGYNLVYSSAWLASTGTVVVSNLNPSTYGTAVTFTATISTASLTVTGTVTWSANTGCGTTTVTAGNPGTATCTTSTLTAGTDVITATYSGNGGLSGSAGTLAGGQVVNQATPVITWANPAGIIYGSALSAVQLNATANTAGAFAYTPPAGTVLAVGNGQTLSVVFTPTDSTDYTTANKSVTINVTPAPPAASPVNLVLTKTLARTGGNIVVTLTLANNGGTAAANVMLNTLSIASTAGAPLPQSLGAIPAGTSIQTTVTVPGSAGVSGAASTISISGTYTGGTFSLTGRVTLP